MLSCILTPFYKPASNGNLNCRGSSIKINAKLHGFSSQITTKVLYSTKNSNNLNCLPKPRSKSKKMSTEQVSARTSRAT
jgi:hypothetical protein